METFGMATEVGKKMKPLRESLSLAQLVLLNVAIAGTFGVLIWSDSCDMAFLHLQVSKDDDTVYLEQHNLSMTDSLANLWDGRAYALATTLCLTSILLPYLLLLALLSLLWLTFKPTAQHHLFLATNLCSKLPLLGVLYLICATNIIQQDVDFTLLQVDYAAFVRVQLDSGIVVLLLAVLLVLVLSLTLKYWHAHHEQQNSAQMVSVSVALDLRSPWSLSECSQPLLFAPRVPGKQLFAVLALVATLGCWLGTLTSPLLSVRLVSGMADYMAAPARELTMIDMGVLSDSSAALVLLSAVYAIMMVLTPLLLMTLLLTLWLLPLPSKIRPRQARAALWCLLCASGLEAMVAMALLLCLEMPKVYAHLLTDEYGDYCAYFVRYLDETCPTLEVRASSGVWLCLVSVLGMNGGVWYTLRVSRREEGGVDGDGAELELMRDNGHKLNDEQYLMGLSGGHGAMEVQPLVDSSAAQRTNQSRDTDEEEEEEEESDSSDSDDDDDEEEVEEAERQVHAVYSNQCQ